MAVTATVARFGAIANVVVVAMPVTQTINTSAICRSAELSAAVGRVEALALSVCRIAGFGAVAFVAIVGAVNLVAEVLHIALVTRPATIAVAVVCVVRIVFARTVITAVVGRTFGKAVAIAVGVLLAVKAFWLKGI